MVNKSSQIFFGGRGLQVNNCVFEPCTLLNQGKKCKNFYTFRIVFLPVSKGQLKNDRIHIHQFHDMHRNIDVFV